MSGAAFRSFPSRTASWTRTFLKRIAIVGYRRALIACLTDARHQMFVTVQSAVGIKRIDGARHPELILIPAKP